MTNPVKYIVPIEVFENIVFQRITSYNKGIESGKLTGNFAGNLQTECQNLQWLLTDYKRLTNLVATQEKEIWELESYISNEMERNLPEVVWGNMIKEQWAIIKNYNPHKNYDAHKLLEFWGASSTIYYYFKPKKESKTTIPPPNYFAEIFYKLTGLKLS